MAKTAKPALSDQAVIARIAELGFEVYEGLCSGCHVRHRLSKQFLRGQNRAPLRFDDASQALAHLEQSLAGQSEP